MPVKKKEPTLALMRHLLASIDLSDIEDKEQRKQMSETDRKDYCAAISAVFPRLEKDLKELLYDQLMFANNNAESLDQITFARGTFNGIDIVYQLWKKVFAEYQSVPKDKDDFDENNPINEL